MEIAFTDYIKAELLILIPVLYALGEWIKASKIDNKFIPLILGGAGSALALCYVLPTCDLNCGWRGVLISIFTAITQGVLCAAASVYANQMVKQLSKHNGSAASGNGAETKKQN
jgi:CDP-diglyceride synthetase